MKVNIKKELKNKTFKEVVSLTKDEFLSYLKRNSLKFITSKENPKDREIPIEKNLYWGDLCLGYFYSPFYYEKGKYGEINMINDWFKKEEVIYKNDDEIDYIGKYDDILFQFISECSWDNNIDLLEEAYTIVYKANNL